MPIESLATARDGPQLSPAWWSSLHTEGSSIRAQGLGIPVWREDAEYLTQLSVLVEVEQVSRLLHEALRQLRTMAAETREEQLAEVFDLRPLSIQQVIAKVESIETGRFYFVSAEEVERSEG